MKSVVFALFFFCCFFLVSSNQIDLQQRIQHLNPKEKGGKKKQKNSYFFFFIVVCTVCSTVISLAHTLVRQNATRDGLTTVVRQLCPFINPPEYRPKGKIKKN